MNYNTNLNGSIGVWFRNDGLSNGYFLGGFQKFENLRTEKKSIILTMVQSSSSNTLEWYSGLVSEQKFLSIHFLNIFFLNQYLSTTELYWKYILTSVPS